MPTIPVQIAAADWQPKGANVIRVGTSLYVRLYLVVSPSESRMGMFKSVDDGATWVQVDADKYAGDYGVSFTPGCGVLAADGTTILVSYNYYLFGAVTETSEVNIATFDTLTDTWGADILGPNLTGPRNTIGYSQNNQVGVRGDGTLVLLWRYTAQPVPFTFQWKFAVWTVATGNQILSASWNTGAAQFIDTTIRGPIAIAADDSAQLFYPRSASGSSAVDAQGMYVRLTAGGVASAEVLAIDTGVLTGMSLPVGVVVVDDAGTDAVVAGVNEQQLPGFDYIPNMLTGAATGAPTVYVPNAGATIRQLSITKIGDVVYAASGFSENIAVNSRVVGFTYTTYENGVWGATTTVNNGAGGEPDWLEFMVNRLAANELGFVLENWDDTTAWFANVEVEAPEPPAPAVTAQLYGGGIPTPTGPRCAVVEGREQARAIVAGRQREREQVRGPLTVCATVSTRLGRRFGSRILRCIP